MHSKQTIAEARSVIGHFRFNTAPQTWLFFVLTQHLYHVSDYLSRLLQLYDKSFLCNVKPTEHLLSSFATITLRRSKKDLVSSRGDKSLIISPFTCLHTYISYTHTYTQGLKIVSKYRLQAKLKSFRRQNFKLAIFF
jgi:hypothetical protein